MNLLTYMYHGRLQSIASAAGLRPTRRQLGMFTKSWYSEGYLTTHTILGTRQVYVIMLIY